MERSPICLSMFGQLSVAHVIKACPLKELLTHEHSSRSLFLSLTECMDVCIQTVARMASDL